MDGLIGGLRSLEDERWKSASSARLAKKLQMPVGFGAADTAWCGNSQTLVSSAASDKALLIWDTERAAVRYMLDRVNGSRAIACSPGMRWVASGRNQRDSSEALRVWDMATPGAPVDLAGPFPLEGERNVNTVRALFFSSDSRFLYVHWTTGFAPATRPLEQRLSIYETDGWKHTNEIVLPPVSLAYRIHPALSSDGRSYAFVHGESTPSISVVDTRSGLEIVRLASLGFRLQALAFGANAQRLFVGGKKMSGRIPDPTVLNEYDIARKKLLRSIPSDHLWDLEAIAYREAANVIVTASNDKTIEIRAGSSGKLLETMGDRTDPLYSVAVRPDGRALVAAGGSFIRLWALPSP